MVWWLSNIRGTGWSRTEVQLESNKHFQQHLQGKDPASQGWEDGWQSCCPCSKAASCSTICCGPEVSPQRPYPLTLGTGWKPKAIKTWHIGAPSTLAGPGEPTSVWDLLVQSDSDGSAGPGQSHQQQMQDAVIHWKPLHWSRDTVWPREHWSL